MDYMNPKSPSELSKPERLHRQANELKARADRLLEQADALAAEAERLQKNSSKRKSTKSQHK